MRFSALLCAQLFPVQHWDTATVTWMHLKVKEFQIQTRCPWFTCHWNQARSTVQSTLFLYCYNCVLKMSLLFINVHRQHYPLKENIDLTGVLTVTTFSTCILKWKGVFYFQMYLVSSYLKENTNLNIITFVHIVFRKTLCLFGEQWYHVFFLLQCYHMTRRICWIKQVIIVAFCCWLPIMFTIFPSLAITSFLHFSYWGITFTQCATKCPGINCYYKHQSSSLLLLPLFL